MNTGRSLRLKGYDYTQTGVYFVTICAYRQANLFGSIADGEMVANNVGRIVADEWMRTGLLRAYVELDTFVVMPNHLHGIIGIYGDDYGKASNHAGDRKLRGLTAGSLGAMVGRFKASATRRIRELPNHKDLVVWQRNFHDYIIRNEKSLNSIREYVATNPAR